MTAYLLYSVFLVGFVYPVVRDRKRAAQHVVLAYQGPQQSISSRANPNPFRYYRSPTPIGPTMASSQTLPSILSLALASSTWLDLDLST